MEKAPNLAPFLKMNVAGVCLELRVYPYANVAPLNNAGEYFPVG